jgi:outer membrane protein OmpA-like peptidoglycan-associated protein
MNNALLSSRWFRISAVILIVLAGILIGLPYLIKYQARIWLEQNGGDRAEIRDVDFNPFTAELILENLLIEVEDQQPLHFDIARLELAWWPLLEKRIDVRAVELQGFYMLVDNRDILRIGGILLPARESKPATQEPADEASAWLAGVHTLTLKDFTLLYQDASLDQKLYIDSLKLSELKQWDPEAPAVLEYRGAVNDAGVEVDARLAPFAQTPNYTGEITIDKLSLIEFEPLAKPALQKLAGLVSIQGEFEIEHKGDDIHVLNTGELKVEQADINQDKLVLTNQLLSWNGATDLTLNTASSQAQVKAEGKLTIEGVDVQHELALIKNQSLGWEGTVDLASDPDSSKTHVKTNGQLSIDGTDVQHELALVRNRSLGWKGAIDLDFDPASSQTHVQTNGNISIEDTNVQHQLVLIQNQLLGWEGVTEVTFDAASSKARARTEGKLKSSNMATDLHQQKLKLVYEDLDVQAVFSYGEGESAQDIGLSADITVAGLDVVAPDRKVDIVGAQKLQLAGLEIKGPEHVSATEIVANKLELGRSRQQQETAPEAHSEAIFRAERVKVSKFSRIDGFTAIDSIVEDDVHAVYHRDKQGKWNVVTLMDALAGEDKDAAPPDDSERGTKKSDAEGAPAKESAKKSTAGGEPEAAAKPPSIAVKRADVSKGSTATIYDESVTPAFKTTLTINELFIENLDARKPDQAATFKLDGQLGKHATVNAGGTIKPFLQPPGMDIQGKMEAIGLPPLSPYTTDSMGVVIDSGSLDLDLKLASKQQLMKGEAVLLMHQLSVKGTDSKDGLQSKIPVPLDMALNILRDKNDAIELKIPIEGDANAPDFDVSDAVTKAVAAGVSAGATSYLAYALQPYGTMIAVAKVAGEAASKISLDPVKFEPGQAALNDTAHDYLSKIAKVLKDRPKLAVKVCGVVVQRDVVHLQPPAVKGTAETAKKEAAPAAPVVDEQKLTELGQQRAASVRDYLVGLKVPAKRLVDCQPRLETDKADAIPRTDMLL